MSKRPRSDAARAPLGLDPVVHERMRLAILSELARQEPLTWRELKQRLDASDGNLNVHTRRLEAGGYIAATITIDRRRMKKTEYRLTAAGRRSLERYLADMAALIQTVKG